MHIIAGIMRCQIWRSQQVGWSTAMVRMTGTLLSANCMAYRQKKFLKVERKTKQNAQVAFCSLCRARVVVRPMFVVQVRSDDLQLGCCSTGAFWVKRHPSLFFWGFHLHRSSLSNGGSKGSLTLLQAPVNDSHKVYKEVIWPLYQILGCCGPCCEVKV